MKKIILILITILTSTILTSQVRFDYLRWEEDNIKEDSTGIIYYTSDPDTILTPEEGLEASIVYYFDDEYDIIRFIPVHRLKIRKDKVTYFGKYNKDMYKITYSKKYGDFVIKKRALLYTNRYTMFFHRDYDYYEQLSN